MGLVHSEIKEEFKTIVRSSTDMSEKFKVFIETEFKELDKLDFFKEFKKYVQRR